MSNNPLDDSTVNLLTENFNTFIQTVRPRCTMGELQVLGAFMNYIRTQDEQTIPGYNNN